jgi:hypothetical protein
MIKIIVAAILHLAPQLTPVEADLYARLIDYESNQTGIHPFLFVAFAQAESGWNYQAKGPTADHGLFQVRVSKTNYPELLGHEHLLHDPILNIYFWARIANYWRNHHYTKCYRRQHHHPWWSHLKWGYKIKDGGTSGRNRAGKIYEQLLKRFPLTPST